MPAPAIVRSASAGLERLLDRVLCVLGAVLFSQLPEFIQQYTQRLEGHLDEARLQIEKFKDAAAQMGMTLDQLVAGSAQGPGAAGQLAAVVRSSVARVDKLASADAALRQASAWTRPFQFAAHLDLPIARATWDIFRPAVPVTAEGLVYALTGMIAALAAYHLLVRMPISGAMRRRRLAKAAVQA
jgi:hypothetical protein